MGQGDSALSHDAGFKKSVSTTSTEVPAVILSVNVDGAFSQITVAQEPRWNSESDRSEEGVTDDVLDVSAAAEHSVQEHEGEQALKDTGDPGTRHAPAVEREDTDSAISSVSVEYDKGLRIQSGDLPIISELFAETTAKVSTKRAPVPAYPFKKQFSIKYSGTHVEVIRHRGHASSQGTRAIAIFLPGIHGGVGPCRCPGNLDDSEALFPTVCRRLEATASLGIDCYRCSWPHSFPSTSTSVSGILRLLNFALSKVILAHEQQGVETRQQIQVIFVGHSFGGAVAMMAAEAVARSFGPACGGAACVSGIATLNSALDFPRWKDRGFKFESLDNVRSLLVCGDSDEVIPASATRCLHKALGTEQSRLLEIPGGTHDLFSSKEQLVEELSHFIAECALSGSQPF